MIVEQKPKSSCSLAKKCGACSYQGISYEKQCKLKEAQAREILGGFSKVRSLIKMEDPYHYRNKVHAVFGRDKRGNTISGIYEANTHKIVPVESCLIEDQLADTIIGTIRGLLKSFKIKTYDEDSQYGLLRHVLIKRGFQTNEVMVVLIVASPIFPSKQNFVKALRSVHPEITTIIQNINPNVTNMVLGDREVILYGKGYIEDILCGLHFRISSKSFYQVNPVQAQILYQTAINMASLTGKETVLDAYCGIGTISLIAAAKAKQVIGIELNKDAVKDAISNAKRNSIKNITFLSGDAGKQMIKMAEKGNYADVVFMDPPRSGSSTEFLDALVKAKPKRVIYISCNPVTLATDLAYLKKKHYSTAEIHPVDMFPWTKELETVCLLTAKSDK